MFINIFIKIMFEKILNLLKNCFIFLIKYYSVIYSITVDIMCLYFAYNSKYKEYIFLVLFLIINLFLLLKEKNK